MADDPLIAKVPEPARDNAAYERRKARQQQHQAEEAARDSPRDSSDRLENDAAGDLGLDQAYADPHRHRHPARQRLHRSQREKDKEKTSFPDAQIRFTQISLPRRPIRVSIFDKSQ